MTLQNLQYNILHGQEGFVMSISLRLTKEEEKHIKSFDEHRKSPDLFARTVILNWLNKNILGKGLTENLCGWHYRVGR